MGASLVFVACAPSAQDLELRRLAKAVHMLETQQSQAEARLSELSSQMIVMQDGRQEPVATDTRMPYGTPPLQVVHLEPEPSPVPGAPHDPPRPEPEPDEEPTVQIVSDAAGDLHATPIGRQARQKEHAQAEFHRALATFQDGHAAQAFDEFAAYVRAFPNTPEADDARFWMGECKFETRAFRDAIVHFDSVRRRAAPSGKAIEALLKIGLSYERLHELDRANASFAELVRRYPQTPSAELAQARLRAMGEPR